MAKQDFVDVTPDIEGKKQVRLSPEDLEIIKNNPSGLTKEGVMAKVWYWSQGKNMPTLIRYLAMYKTCENFTKSETLTDGNVILARKTFTTRQGIRKEFIWKEKIGMLNELGEPIIANSIEELEEFVKGKLGNLRFITTVGV